MNFGDFRGLGSIFPEVSKVSLPRNVPEPLLKPVPVPKLSPNFGDGDKEFRGLGTALASLGSAFCFSIWVTSSLGHKNVTKMQKENSFYKRIQFLVTTLVSLINVMQSLLLFGKILAKVFLFFPYFMIYCIDFISIWLLHAYFGNYCPFSSLRMA